MSHKQVAKFDDRVVIFTLPKCKNSMLAKNMLARGGVAVREYDASIPENLEMLKTRGEFTTVPQIFVNNIWLGGYNRLAALARSGELRNLL